MKYKLKRFASTNNNMGTDEMIGFFTEPPKDGQSFTIYQSGGNNFSDVVGRFITTSIVTKVMKTSGGWQFRTLNSVYSLTEVKE